MKLYRRWIENWERRRTLQDTNRRILPFEWGLEWVSQSAEAGSPQTIFKKNARAALEESTSYFSAPPISNAVFERNQLTFAAPVPSPVEENNTVYCRFFPSARSSDAVVVLPQWNCDERSHVSLCRILQLLGITSIRLTLPYHGARRPATERRADLMVGPNIGRTLHATRQAVLEVRQLVQWLSEHGYNRMGVMGTSIGSCVAYLAFVHDPAVSIGVFNHVSASFADVVWTGLSTRYIRWGLDGNVQLEDLREFWAPISPIHHIGKLKGRPRPHLMITAQYDLTFLPRLSEMVFAEYDRQQIPYDRVTLPCGHYTTGSFPFKYLDGWHICSYLARGLAGLRESPSRLAEAATDH